MKKKIKKQQEKPKEESILVQSLECLAIFGAVYGIGKAFQK